MRTARRSARRGARSRDAARKLYGEEGAEVGGELGGSQPPQQRELGGQERCARGNEEQGRTPWNSAGRRSWRPSEKTWPAQSRGAVGAWRRELGTAMDWAPAADSEGAAQGGHAMVGRWAPSEMDCWEATQGAASLRRQKRWAGDRTESGQRAPWLKLEQGAAEVEQRS